MGTQETAPMVDFDSHGPISAVQMTAEKGSIHKVDSVKIA